MAGPTWAMLSAISIFLLISGTNGQSPTVSLDGLGQVNGKESTTINGRTIHSFQGIPYGESTAGSQRFQPPVPKLWSGTIDATSPPVPCIQPDFSVLKNEDKSSEHSTYGLYDTIGSEDCLTVSVYTPDLSHTQSLPVLVYFHGDHAGGLLNGDESEFRPDYLLDRDVILVVPHYRLGAFGFLSMQNDIIPGNAGLLDSVEALRWIQTHISKFGGDPTRVTVSGHNTGSGLAQYMVITPLTDGLVHGAILMSGSFLTPTAYDPDPVGSGRGIAAVAGCAGSDDELTNCMYSLTAQDLIAAHRIYHTVFAGNGALQPAISRPNEPAETRVLPEDPRVTIQSGNYKAVPILAGATRHDGMIYLNVLDRILSVQNLTNNEFFVKTKLVPTILSNAGITDNTGSITDMLEYKYFSTVAADQRGNYLALCPGLLDYHSTEYMKAPANRIVQVNAEKADSYLYTFSYNGRYHIPGNGINNPPTLFEDAVSHGDDILYLTPRVTDPFNAEELNVVNVLTTLWSNFVTSGNPNIPVATGLPEWPKYDLVDESYFEINLNSVAKKDYTEEFLVAINDNLPYTRNQN